MADVFNRNTGIFGGSFSADSVRVAFPELAGLTVESSSTKNFSGLLGMLIQNLSMNYSQQVTRLYEIGTPATYYVAGRTSGTGAIGRVIGPTALINTFYSKFGDVCQAKTNSLAFSATAGCTNALNDAVRPVVNPGTQPTGGGQAVTITAKFVVLIQLAISVNAEQMVIGENLNYIFSSLDYATGVTNPTGQPAAA